MLNILWHENVLRIAWAEKPLIAIIGPTTGGKTGLSLNVAQFLRDHGARPEIINADSRQLYKGLDIGTAKIRPEEMQGITHRLLSVLDPGIPVTIAWFQEQATAIIKQIHQRNGVPILVGGSMLYISSVIDGLLPMQGDLKIRERLSDAYDADEGISLHALLHDIDPVSAAAIPKENKVYLIRALEIFELTGKPKSAALQTHISPYDLVMLGVAPPREIVLKNIRDRIDAMFDAGWIDEVKILLQSGISKNDPALESHGYREIAAWIESGEKPGEIAALKESIARKTAQYAKRQMTWWKDDERIIWIAAD